MGDIHPLKLTSLFCPVAESRFGEYYVLKNGISNNKDRVSIDIEFVKCNKEYNDNCETDDSKVNELLDSMLFT